MSEDIWRWDAVDLARAIRLGGVTSRDAVASCLQRLDSVNGKINAVTVVLAESALAQADAADRALKRGDAIGPLHGLPVTIKENVDHAGTATTNGVVAFKDMIAETDCPAVANWKRAGAIVIGRTNTPAFSLRWHTDNELRGATKNPWDKARTPGGSSGGAAASLAVGITPLAHGTDYGGSIRYPAYCCGIAGIRPTLGRVPVFNGSAPEERTITAQIMAVQGPMARRIRDVRLGLAPMAASDPRDPWFVPAPLAGAPPAHPIKVALTVDPGKLGVDPAVAAAVRQAGDALARAGYAVELVEPPSVEAIAELWWALAWTETRHIMAPTMRKLGGKDVVRALDVVLSTTPDLDLAGYMKGLASRAKHVRDWLLFLERYPLVVGPVSTEPPFPVGFDTDDAADPRRLMHAQRLLIAINLLGCRRPRCRWARPARCRSASRSSARAIARICASTPPR
ncbi:MAG: amidase [Pseudomonadota bacterium]